ncbi:MAG: hypothetical protein ABJI22_18745 [Maribacter sp.]
MNKKRQNIDKKRKSIYKDEILSYLNSEIQRPIEVNEINRIVTNNTLSMLNLLNFCHEIMDDQPSLLKRSSYLNKITFQATEATSVFLENSGFEKLYNEEINQVNIAKAKSEELENQQADLRKEQHKNLKLSNQLTEYKIKTHYLPIVISVLSLMIAAWALYNRSEKPMMDEDLIKEIQTRMDYIEGSLLKENDELKEKIYKSEIWIETLEADSLK